jgi:hypothetical protein
MDNTTGGPGADPTPADAARRIKDSAATVVDRGKQEAAHLAEQGAERVASSAQTTASALRRAADDVEPDNAWIGKALRKSADSLEQATRSLAGGDLSSGMTQLNSFARRQPAIFLGASVALGFALARVGKTAIERAGDSGDRDLYQPTTPEI